MEWISVEDRLPKLGEAVALINIDRWENTAAKIERNLQDCGYLSFSGQNYWSVRAEGARSIDTYTHWMPLPEPPK